MRSQKLQRELQDVVILASLKPVYVEMDPTPRPYFCCGQLPSEGHTLHCLAATDFHDDDIAQAAIQKLLQQRVTKPPL